MQARKRQQYEMSGIAVGMLLKPSKGIRDDIVRSGLKPKNHIKENKMNLLKIEKANKLRKEQLEKPEPKPFKLQAFANVESKLKNILKSGSSTPTTPLRNSATPPTKKNYITINAKNARSAPVSRAPSAVPTPIPGKAGHIPKYLIKRKLEWAKREQDRLIAIQKEKVPKGQALLPDKERMRTLNALCGKRDDLIREIQLLPLVIEVQSLKRRKQQMETQLHEAESAIAIFSRSKVYVNISDLDKMNLNTAA